MSLCMQLHFRGKIGKYHCDKNVLLVTKQERCWERWNNICPGIKTDTHIDAGNMATFFVLRHPVTTLVTAFTNPDSLTNFLLILKKDCKETWRPFPPHTVGLLKNTQDPQSLNPSGSYLGNPHITPPSCTRPRQPTINDVIQRLHSAILGLHSKNYSKNIAQGITYNCPNTVGI